MSAVQCRQQGAARYCIFAVTLSSLLQACSFKIPRQHPVSGEQKPGQAGWAQLVKEKSRSLVLWPGFLRRPRRGRASGRGQERTGGDRRGRAPLGRLQRWLALGQGARRQRGPAVGAVAAPGHNGIISGQPRLQKSSLPVLAPRHKLSAGRSPPRRAETARSTFSLGTADAAAQRSIVLTLPREGAQFQSLALRVAGEALIGRES